MAQEDDLFRQLSLLQIKDKTLSQQILESIRLGIPYFTALYKSMYPDGTLEIELHCRRQQNSDAPSYKLSQYKGKFIKDIQFGEEAINGTTLKDLDLELSSIDWPNYFMSLRDLKKSKLESDIVSSAARKLWSLSDYNNIPGKQAQDLLRIKHWSNTPWDDPSLADQRRTLENHMVFNPQVMPHCTRELCYYLLSGKFDRMMHELGDMGFAPEFYLQRTLAFGLPEFSLHLNKIIDDDLVRYQLDYIRDGHHDYHFNCCKASLVMLPEIEHGLFAGIDTALLERQMAAIDWLDEDSHYCYLDGEPMFISPISEIVASLEGDLAIDPIGYTVACQLQLKYWSDSPDFEGIISQDAWDYCESLSQITATFSEQIHADHIYHLLNGRSVFLEDSRRPGWRELNQSSDNSDKLILERISNFSPDDLYNSLLHLPCSPEIIQGAVRPLLDGNCVSLDLNTGKSIQVEADPKRASIRIYSDKGIPIYTNLLLEPGNTQINSTPDINAISEEKKSPLKSSKAWVKRAKKKGKHL